MSHSIFSSALSRALLRRPISRPLLTKLNSTLFPRDASDHNVLRRNWILGRASRRKVWGVNSTPHRPHKPKEEQEPRDLLTLLHSLGQATGIAQKRHGKIDLSWFDPLAPPWRGRKYGMRLRQWSKFSLKGITERFIYWLYYRAPKAGKMPVVGSIHMLEKVFPTRAIKYLESKGYQPEDVMVWAWVLMSRDGTIAGLRLDLWTRVGFKGVSNSKHEISNWKSSQALKVPKWITTFDGIFEPSDVLNPPPHLTRLHPPSFLLLFLLRHPHLQPPTLSSLLPHIQHALSPNPDRKSPLLILIRLLRHLRTTWPSALPLCAHLITTLPPSHPSARLTHTYNRLLTLFSHPSHHTPFKSLLHHQRSQFLLLRHMAALSLPITREGYRALTSLQLAHSKTPLESAHTRTLSPSWPPWPTRRDGHPRPLPAAPSRAAQVLAAMAEAGYPLCDWESEARVLAGTDTDGSPTIQTRTFYNGGMGLWGVRVRATRTLQEAWSVFREFLNSGEVAAAAAGPWEEMFEKVLGEAKGRRLREWRERRLEGVKAVWEGEGMSGRVVGRLRRWDVEQRRVMEREARVLPGDAKEVVMDCGEHLHLHLHPPPGVEELFMMMRRVVGRKKINDRIIAMLVRESQSLEAGEWVLKTWSKERLRRLKKGAAPPNCLDTPPSSPFTRLEAHPSPRILTSYLYLLLSRVSSTTLPRTARISLAIRLLLGHSPPYPPAWNTVLRGLTTLHSASLWRVYKAMTRLISPDAETLRLLCVAAERARGLWDGEDPVECVVGVVKTALQGGPPYVVVEEAMLHAYVRVLGRAGRREEIWEVVGWMKGCGEMEWGVGMGRRVVVACWVFLGGEWDEGGVWEVGEEEGEEYCVLGGMY